MPKKSGIYNNYMDGIDFSQYKIIAYARKSKIEKKQKDEKDILSIEDQVKFLDGFAAKHNIKYVKVKGEQTPVRENISAYNPGIRPGFSKGVEMVLKGEADGGQHIIFQDYQETPKKVAL